MATPQSSFIVKHLDSFGGNFIDSQYLGAAYETGKPVMLEGMLHKIYSSQTDFWQGKTLSSIIGTANIKEIDGEIYRWELQGAEEKCARVVENLEPTNLTPGINGTTFKIKLDLDFYMNPDVLMPESNLYPLQVIDGPIQDGSGYVYTVRLETDRTDLFVPPDMLEVSKEFSKVWTSVASEFNERHGGIQYPDRFKLEHQIGAFAEKIVVTDKAWRQSGMLNFDFIVTDANGVQKTVSKFLPMAEAKMEEQLMLDMERQYIYGQRSTKPTPDSKYWTKTGAGIREQMKDGLIIVIISSF